MSLALSVVIIWDLFKRLIRIAITFYIDVSFEPFLQLRCINAKMTQYLCEQNYANICKTMQA